LIWGKDIVLELKFTNRFPDWFRELVRVFGLRQCGAAKYVDGVATLGEYRLDPRRVSKSGEGLDKEVFAPNGELALKSERETSLI
jgi:hypothetical protein